VKDRIFDILDKLPVVPILVLYGAWAGWDYYGFTTADDSPVRAREAQIQSAEEETRKTQAKLKELEEFARNLERKRAEVRGLASKLDEMKATLTEELDIPELVKLVVREAQKVGLTVVSIRPTEQKPSEFYVEQSFELAFKGVFVQLLVYLERLSSLERIVRVDNFDVKAAGASTSAYVELEGKIEVKAYRYNASSADQVAKEPGAHPAAPEGGAK
jgi:Tfp pilus assembly protein PilO